MNATSGESLPVLIYLYRKIQDGEFLPRPSAAGPIFAPLDISNIPSPLPAIAPSYTTANLTTYNPPKKTIDEVFQKLQNKNLK